jgi:hypothetical protein
MRLHRRGAQEEKAARLAAQLQLPQQAKKEVS